MILPSLSICTLWGTNYSGSSKFLESAFKLKRNSPSCANVIHKTLSLAIARCFLTEGGKKKKLQNSNAVDHSILLSRLNWWKHDDLKY